MNPIVRGFIASETAFWSGINAVGPIFAVFVADHVSGGSVEAAGTSVTVYLLARVMVELFVARILNQSTDDKKFVFAMSGTFVVGLCYVGFMFADNIVTVLFLQAAVGASLAVASPAKYALFSEHLDKGKESTEWGVYDAVSMGGMALTAAIGGYVAQTYGFAFLFGIAATLILIGTLPFALFVFANKKGKKQLEKQNKS